MKKIILSIILLCLITGLWYLHSEIYSAVSQERDRLTFEVKQGESVKTLAERLDQEQVIRNPWLFRKYIQWKKADKDIHVGIFQVEKPITLARVVEALKNPGVAERTITIIPGWNIRDIAEYLEKEGIGSKEETLTLLGQPAKQGTSTGLTLDAPLKLLRDKPSDISYEGYIRPDTFRVYKDASLNDVLVRLIKERDKEFTDDIYRDIENFFDRMYPGVAKGQYTLNMHELLTMASILEREVRSPKDRAMVADLFWRRYMEWIGFNADSTVHYIFGSPTSVFTTNEERGSTNPWNTYKYWGLPPGPISTPSMVSIKAALYPEKNPYYYFLTTLDTGEVKYAKTLEEHNANVQKYLR